MTATVSPHVVVALVLALCLAVDASQGQLCLDACACSLNLTRGTALLHAHCDNVTVFPSLRDSRDNVVLLRLGDGEDLKPLKDFSFVGCKLNGIDRSAFEGLDDLDPTALAPGVLVQVPFGALVGENGVVLELARSGIVDCHAFITEFGNLRPTVNVLECDDDDLLPRETKKEDTGDANTPASEHAASAGNENDDTTTELPAPDVKRRNYAGDTIVDVDADADATSTEEDYDVIWPRPDERRRDASGDIVIEDTDDTPGDGVQRLEGVMPSVTPDEDPATVFAPWTIAVIAGVGAIIVAVVAYYVWQRWTEIRSCCCRGEYSQP